MEDIKIEDTLLPAEVMHNPKKPYVKVSLRQKKYINAFNDQVARGEILFEKVPCLCSHNVFSLLASVDRYSMLQQTVVCKKCGLILSNPRMTEPQYKLFYTSDVYRNCYEPQNFLETYESFYHPTYGKHIIDAVCKVKDLKGINSVLEIGAGGGWNLIPFQSQKMLVQGCEYSPSLVALGVKHGIPLVEGGVDELKGSFDLILLNHVLEHFSDPILSLKKIREHLNPGGIIYVAVPDMGHFSMAQLQNAHTYYFNLATLRYYASKSGLKMIHHQPAETVHLAAIFSEGNEALPDNFLDENYQNTMLSVKTYRRRLENKYITMALGILDIIGLRKIIRTWSGVIKKR